MVKGVNDRIVTGNHASMRQVIADDMTVSGYAWQ